MAAAQGWANLQELRRHGLDLIRSAVRPEPRRATIFAIRNGHMSFQRETPPASHQSGRCADGLTIVDVARNRTWENTTYWADQTLKLARRWGHYDNAK